MIKRKAGYTVDHVENMRGGEGIVIVEHLLTPEEFYNKGRLFAKMTLKPGASIGKHLHEGEMESYYIIGGKGEYMDGTDPVTLLPGDTALTKSGEEHSIKSIGDVPLELIALILYK